MPLMPTCAAFAEAWAFSLRQQQSRRRYGRSCFEHLYENQFKIFLLRRYYSSIDPVVRGVHILQRTTNAGRATARKIIPIRAGDVPWTADSAVRFGHQSKMHPDFLFGILPPMPAWNSMFEYVVPGIQGFIAYHCCLPQFIFGNLSIHRQCGNFLSRFHRYYARFRKGAPYQCCSNDTLYQ